MLNLTTFFAKLTKTNNATVAAPVVASKEVWNVFTAACSLYTTVATQTEANEIAKLIGGWIATATR